MLRKILGVVAGYVAWTVIWLGGNAALAAASPESFDEQGATSSAGLLALLLVLSVVASLVAGRLSVVVGRAPVALWTGVLLLLTGIGVQIGYWELLPVWYHLSFLALLVPATLLGGRRRPG